MDMHSRMVYPAGVPRIPGGGIKLQTTIRLQGTSQTLSPAGFAVNFRPLTCTFVATVDASWRKGPQNHRFHPIKRGRIIKREENRMKISELIETLIALHAEHGDVDVYSHNDMIADDPSPTYIEGGEWMAEGVYLN